MSGVYAIGSLPRNPTIYNVTMTVADTEYSQQLSQNTKIFTIHTRDESEFRLAFATGYVATPTEPYFTIKAGSRGYTAGVDVYVANTDWNGTLYFASDSAGKIIEIIEWV